MVVFISIFGILGGNQQYIVTHTNEQAVMMPVHPSEWSPKYLCSRQLSKRDSVLITLCNSATEYHIYLSPKFKKYDRIVWGHLKLVQVLCMQIKGHHQLIEKRNKPIIFMLRLFDVLPNFPFTTNETMDDYYL